MKIKTLLRNRLIFSFNVQDRTISGRRRPVEKIRNKRCNRAENQRREVKNSRRENIRRTGSPGRPGENRPVYKPGYQWADLEILHSVSSFV
ncbi:hypothetical protein Hanom_Chr16g01485741 [Helianthus anomalus]